MIIPGKETTMAQAHTCGDNVAEPRIVAVGNPEITSGVWPCVYWSPCKRPGVTCNSCHAHENLTDFQSPRGSTTIRLCPACVRKCIKPQDLEYVCSTAPYLRLLLVFT